MTARPRATRGANSYLLFIYMDDRTFDENTARVWIRGIETAGSRVRDQDVYPRLRAWVERSAARQILEIGCGQGACAGAINLSGREYTGTDPSAFMIERARELYEGENCRFTIGNAYDLPFADGQFDGVFSIMLWHLLSDLPKAAAEMAKVLQRRGSFLILTANPDAYSEWMSLYVNAKLEGRRFEGDMLRNGKAQDRDVLYFHTREEIINALESAKLEIASIECFRKSQQEPGKEYLICIQATLPGATLH